MKIKKKIRSRGNSESKTMPYNDESCSYSCSSSYSSSYDSVLIWQLCMTLIGCRREPLHAPGEFSRRMPTSRKTPQSLVQTILMSCSKMRDMGDMSPICLTLGVWQ